MEAIIEFILKGSTVRVCYPLHEFRGHNYVNNEQHVFEHG